MMAGFRTFFKWDLHGDRDMKIYIADGYIIGFRKSTIIRVYCYVAMMG